MNLVAIKWQLEALSLLTVSLSPSLQPVSQNHLLFVEIQRSFAQKEADTGTNHCCSDGLKQSGNHPKTASCQPVKRKEEDVNAILAIALHCILVH